MGTAIWSSQEFQVFSKDAKWNDVPGVYIFAGVNQLNQWHALYVGQASSLTDRLTNHERWQEARRLGATHVHVKVLKAAADRDTLEQTLIRGYKPALNTHFA